LSVTHLFPSVLSVLLSVLDPVLVVLVSSFLILLFSSLVVSHSSFGSLQLRFNGLLIARGASVSTCCPRSRFVHSLDIVHALDVSSSFRLTFGSSYQFRFVSMSRFVFGFRLNSSIIRMECVSIR